MFEAPLSFDEAVEWFRARVPMTDEQWDKLTKRARQQAFTVSGVADLDMVSEVWRALDKAVSKGTTFADFADSVRGPLESAWGGEKPFRLDTIFRTNVQLSYSAGRQEQQSDPAVLKQRPFWKYSAILDSRSTSICRGCNGTVLAADDPWWETHQPPLHFNCRSTVISLSKSQAERAGVAEAAPEIEPSDGFGDPMRPWAPSSKDYPHDLWHAYEGGAGKGGGGPGGGSGGGGGDGSAPPAPWFTDQEPRPPGTMTGPRRRLATHELGLAVELVNEGNFFVVSKDTHGKTGKEFEGWIGTEPDVPRDLAHKVELKHMQGGSNPKDKLKKKVLSSIADGGQAPNIVIDARESSLTIEQAFEAVAEIRGREHFPDAGPLWHIRIKGLGFDRTFSDL